MTQNKSIQTKELQQLATGTVLYFLIFIFQYIHSVYSLENSDQNRSSSMYPLDVHRWYANGMLFNEVYDVNISAAKDGCV